MNPKMTIGFIGGGNMATAIGTALISKNIVKPENMWVSSATEKTLNKWKPLGVSTTLDNDLIVEKCDIVILAVKPQMLETVCHSLKKNWRENDSKMTILISLLVGVSIETLKKKLEFATDFIRIMPSTPSIVGEGISVCCFDGKKNSDSWPEDYLKSLAETLFSPLGAIKFIPESLINAYGALSGSGPAYGYLLIEALSDGAVKMGVPRATATEFAARVMIGAGKMVLETGKHPGQLKDEVCSPMGTTIAGIHALERAGVRSALMDAVEAARKRADEIEKPLVHMFM